MAAPVCKICKKTEGVTFAIFTPAIPPFGTACVPCERKVELWLEILKTDAKPSDCDIYDNGEVWLKWANIGGEDSSRHERQFSDENKGIQVVPTVFSRDEEPTQEQLEDWLEEIREERLLEKDNG